MLKKPTVAIIMPDWTCAKMFRDRDLDLLKQHADVVGPVDRQDPKAVGAALASVEAALTGWGSPAFDVALLRQAPSLKMIAHTAGSLKGLVSDAVYDRGIAVTTAASANAVPVAQYTVAMMVAMLKQIPWLTGAYARNDRLEVEKRKGLCRELEDMTIAIIGASRVGREVLRLLKNYPNIDILCYDPYLSDEAARQLGVRKASLEDCCRCELVSIHAPNIPETRRMFNACTLALLPDQAVLINTSRGALVDEAALIAEVRRRPLYVLLDVTDPEPPALDSPLRTEPNILITPHIAGAMKQACKTMGRLAIDEVLRFLRGEKLQHQVTRAMLATQA